MTRSSDFSLGSEFDGFLFAPIGEDRNGMPLSVLSALARLNVDPWQEAAKLARLPAEKATKRLTSLIAALPDGPSVDRDPGTIAARLIALLPRQVGPSIPAPRAAVLWAGTTAKSRVILFVIFLVLVLDVGYFLAVRHPPAPLGNAQTQISSTVSPRRPTAAYRSTSEYCGPGPLLRQLTRRRPCLRMGRTTA